MFDFLSNKFSSIFSNLTGNNKLTEKNIENTLTLVHDALLDADVPYDVVQTFLKEIKDAVVGQAVIKSLKPSEQLMKIVHDKLLVFLGGQSSDSAFSFQIPSVIMVMGLQGSGKTTTLSKLACFIRDAAQKRGKTRRILLASVDFYRPAAIDQLEILAAQAGVSFYRATSLDVVAAAVEIYAYSQKNQFEMLLLDTAGRLHVDAGMLQELQQIDSRLKPKYKLMVLDAMTGQESLNVAQAFEREVGFSGAVLTKMDSDTRGGAAFAFRYVIKKPILFVGMGEKSHELDLFRPERMASRIIGMGDVLSLVEKANEKIKQVDQEKMHSAMMQGKMTLQDFADQMSMVGKLGSLSQLINYLPGAGSLKVSSDMIEKGEADIKKFKAIIASMTVKERVNPKVLDVSRKKRIAQGAGVDSADVSMLLERFEQSQQFVKMFKKGGRFNQLFK